MHQNPLRYPTIVLMAATLFALSGCNTTDFSDGLTNSTTSSAPKPVEEVNTEQPSNRTALVEEAPANASDEQINIASTQTEPGSSATNLRQVSFLPVTGAPQRAVTTLTAALKSSAQQNSIQLIPSNFGTTKYQIKGYFSALDDGSGTLVVYVWDVLNNSGKRIHRIAGQQRSGGSNSDPWSAITETEIKRVADDTMARLSSYLNRG